MLGCTEKKEQTIEEKSTVEEQVKNTLGIKIYNNITTLESRRDIPREANMMSEIFTGLKKNQWKVNEDVTLNLCGQGRTFVINIGIDEYIIIFISKRSYIVLNYSISICRDPIVSYNKFCMKILTMGPSLYSSYF